jgi:hypothetical protein
MIDEEKYNKYIEEVNVFLREVNDRILLRTLATSPDKLADAVVKLHELFSAQQYIHASRVVISYRSNSLATHDQNAIDDRTIVIDFTPVDTPMFTYGMHVSTLDELICSVKIVDSNGTKYDAMTLVIPKPYEKSDKYTPSDNLIIVFTKPLDKGKKYTLTITTNANQVLYDINNNEKNNQDSIVFDVTKLDKVDEVEIVAYIPRFLNVKVRDFVGSHRSDRGKWKVGVKLETAALDKLPGSA